MVEFCSTGPGSQLFTPHLRNDQVHAKILQATGDDIELFCFHGAGFCA
jgi:hypothetical protein